MKGNDKGHERSAEGEEGKNAREVRPTCTLKKARRIRKVDEMKKGKKYRKKNTKSPERRVKWKKTATICTSKIITKRWNTQEQRNKLEVWEEEGK